MSNKGITSTGGDIVRLTMSKGIVLLMSTLTGMLLARFRTLEEYGTYSQLLLVINLFTSFFMLGLPNSINYFLSRVDTREEQQKFLSVYYTLSTIQSIIMGGVLVLSVPLIVSYFDNPAINGFAYFLALYPWSRVISSSIENVLVVYKKTHFLMIYRVINSACVLGAVYIVQWLSLGFREYIVSYLAVECIFALTVYILVYRISGHIGISFSLQWIRKIFVFSIPIGLASIVGTIDIEIDKLLIGKLMDTEQLAIYTNASKELPLTIISMSITAILLPKFARMLKDNRSLHALYLWNTATELSLIIMSLLVSGLFVFADEVIEILYTAKYLPGVSVFRVYTLVLLLRVTYFGIILNAKGKTKPILWCSIAALVLNAVLNPFFYLWFGMIGPAIATLLSMLITAVLQLLLTSKVIMISFWEMFPFKRTSFIFIINAIFCIVFYIIKKFIPLEHYVGDIFESLILGLLWSIIYLFYMQNRIMFSVK